MKIRKKTNGLYPISLFLLQILDIFAQTRARNNIAIINSTRELFMEFITTNRKNPVVQINKNLTANMYLFTYPLKENISFISNGFL